MPICRICQYENPPLAIACHQCGVYLDQDVLQGNITPPNGTTLPLPIFGLHISATEVRFEMSNESIILPPESQIYIGREFASHFSNAHIDLGPYSALAYGVSRIHARLEHDLLLNYAIVDLGSTNGTLLNNQLLTAFHSYPLTHDDLLCFGDFPMLVHINA